MRDLISKGLLTAAAASSVLSMTGGYAIAADSDGVAAGSPGILSGNNVQAPLEIPVNVCGNTVNPVGVANPAFGNGCGSTSGSAHSSAHEADRAAPVREHRPASGQAAPAPLPRPHPEGHDRPAHAPDPRPQAAPAPAVHQVPAPHAASSTHAHGTAAGSPGVLSGNLVQAPLELILNACGNSADVVGLLNPAFGNGCATDPAAPPVDEVVEVPEPPKPVEDRSVVPHTPPTRPNHPKPMAPEPEPLPQPPVASPAPPQLAETGGDPHLLAAAAMSAGLLLGGGILYRRSTAKARV